MSHDTEDQKRYRGFIFKGHVKLEEKLAYDLENDIRNLTNLHQNIQKSQKFAL